MFKHHVSVFAFSVLIINLVGCTEDDVVPIESDASVDQSIRQPVDAVEIDVEVVDAEVVDATPDISVDAGLMDRQTCDVCESDGDCEVGLYCVISAVGSAQTCLPGCVADEAACPRGFECEDIQRDLTPTVAVCVPQDAVCCVDEDGDGYGVGMDCNGSDCVDDNDRSHAGAEEACNGLDDDCDSIVDEGEFEALCPPAANVSQTACVEGTCELISCDMGFGDCNLDIADGCELPLNTLTDCASCGAVCSVPNATTNCDALMCELSTCDEGFADCDAAPENGCETSLRTPTDCGSCGDVCELPNATATCTEGICAVERCDEGFGNCDGLAENGCETSLLSIEHCSGCNQSCARVNGVASCESGACTLTACNSGFGNCDGVDANGCEVSLNTELNCLACGVSCELDNAQAACEAGGCSVQSCNPGWGNCDAVDLNGCERSLDSLVDCGGCGNVCDRSNAINRCVNGQCELAQCFEGYSDCDGSSINGCEVSHSDIFGACGGVPSVGTYDGDRSCGFTCGSNTSWNRFAARTGTNSAWFRGRVREDSTCSADIEHQIRLTVPDGVDYDLFVYRSCSGSPVATSMGLAGVDEIVTVRSGDAFASDDDFDYWVEVRFFGGSSCSQWTLNFYGHDC